VAVANATLNPLGSSPLRSALAATEDDRIVFDLDGIADRYHALVAELPGISVRFALKSCPVDEVLTHLADRGAGFDAASPNEIAQAKRCGAAVDKIHYGNTIKSDQNIAAAYALGVRDFATDSVQDLKAIATHAPGARVFCRLATSGEGALWGLSHKFGCSNDDAVAVMSAARALGLTPAGLSVHVGSQQMTVGAWHQAIDDLASTLIALKKRGIFLEHVNFGGGLPALGYLDRRGQPLEPRLDEMFAAIRQGMQRLRSVAGRDLAFVIEPGRHLVADHGVIRAHVVRLTTRTQRTGEREYWLYLSCGKFNGLNETDQLHYRLQFPNNPGGEYVSAFVAGPTCDGSDVFDRGHLVRVPITAASGDPVWILSSGAYAVSYMTCGFNGFDPLPQLTVSGQAIGADVASVGRNR